MADFIHWPTNDLKPASAMASQVAFSRSGGRSLGGVERVIKTDKGFWRIALNDVSVRTPQKRRQWNAIRTVLNGRAGVVAVPCWSIDSAPYVDECEREPPLILPHDDGTYFDDGTGYYEGALRVFTASYAALGATTISLRIERALTVEGIRFSYQHALYETGPIIEQVGIDEYQVPIFPAIRRAIPGGSWLEVDNPTCLCHLAEDRGMDLNLSSTLDDTASVEFVEAVDVWNDIAQHSPNFSPTLYGSDGLDFRYVNNSQYFPLF